MKQEKISEMENIIAADYDNMAGIVIMKDGKAVYEGYFHNCTDASRIHVSSVTKSILSILIGIALDKGCIDSVSQKVLEFFPDYTVKRGEKTIQHITIKDMLTMTAPYKYKGNPYTKYFTSMDWVKFSLDVLGGRGHIGEFRYAPIVGPDILSSILVKATGQSVFDFAKENLFAPLGITIEKTITFHNKEEQMAFYKGYKLLGCRSNRCKYGGLGTYALTDGYGQDRAVILKSRYLEREAHRLGEVDSRKHIRAEPLDAARFAVRLSVVDC